MKLIPILFSTPMVPPIIIGNKMMTRRTRGLRDINKNPDKYSFHYAEGEMFDFVENGTQNHIVVKCPYGQAGDVMWVKESFCLTQPFHPETYYFGYKSGVQPYSNEPASEKYDFSTPDRWKPNIYMPFEACRIFLRVKEIRVERLLSISDEDAAKEGVHTLELYPGYNVTPKGKFMGLWSLINGIEDEDTNPWVWVIAFERINSTREIAAIREQWNENKSERTK